MAVRAFVLITLMAFLADVLAIQLKELLIFKWLVAFIASKALLMVASLANFNLLASQGFTTSATVQ